MYSQNVYQNQRLFRISIYIEPVLISREGCNAFEDLLFLEVIFAYGEIFVNQLVSFAALFTLKTAPNSHEECNEFADLLF